MVEVGHGSKITIWSLTADNSKHILLNYEQMCATFLWNFTQLFKINGEPHCMMNFNGSFSGLLQLSTAEL